MHEIDSYLMNEVMINLKRKLNNKYNWTLKWNCICNLQLVRPETVPFWGVSFNLKSNSSDLGVVRSAIRAREFLKIVDSSLQFLFLKMVKVGTFFAMSFGAFLFWETMDKVHVWIALHQDEKVFFFFSCVFYVFVRAIDDSNWFLLSWVLVE